MEYLPWNFFVSKSNIEIANETKNEIKTDGGKEIEIIKGEDAWPLERG